jgi:CRISPR-associated protein Csc3
MSNVSQPSSEEQLSFLEEKWSSDEDFGFDADPNDRQVESQQPPEIITLKLLRRAIAAQNPDDEIMRDFGEFVLPNLLRVAIGVTAKGGKYFEQKEQEYRERQIREQRETIKPISRRSADDQSLNTHLLNGLFPANLIEQRLEELDTTIQRLVRPKPQRRRFAIAGFILHDFEKFDYNRFPSMPAEYKAVPKDDIRKLGIPAHREIIAIIIQELGLDRFINPDNPEVYKDHIDDLLYVAYNAQRKDDTNLNTSDDYGLDQLTLPDNLLPSLADLARLADLLASVIKHPQDAEAYTLYKVLHELSDGQLELTYHSIAENHGVLTNVVNNAVMDEFTSLNTPECKYYEPLLYLPTGVIYLKLKNAPPVAIAPLPDRVIQKIKVLCAEELQTRQKGFVREGKGMKYAEYYDLFFQDVELMRIALKAACKSIRNSKASDRSNSLVEFQKKKALSQDYDFSFGNDVRIDQLAEFGDLVTRKIWGSRVEKIQAWAKKNKQKVDLGELESGNFLVHKIAEHWGLAQYLPQIREIQEINESLKQLKLKGNTGGLPLEWYYLAAQYIKHYPGCEDITKAGERLIECVENLIAPILTKHEINEDGWDDLRDWVRRVVMLPNSQAGEVDKFLEELNRYNAAKQQRRGKQLICSISHSAYTVKEQMESAVLFTPQVYTNKQMLGGSNAKRNISSIAAIEFMLRQILMSETQEVGKKFEDGKYRYLYFYPTYYFTPETNRFLHEAYDQIQQTRFDAGVRNHFISKQLQADFSLTNYQTTGLFQLKEIPGANLSETEKPNDSEEPEAKKVRIFKLNYSENQPMTFYFMALPPEKRGKTDPTDTESWVMPTWLAFAFPMILDVKTVVSESPIPPCTDGTEFEQTVFLDSAPQAFRVLTKDDHFRLDYILEGWERNGAKYPAPLKVLTAAYAIHLDVNAKQGKGGYNANWGRLAELARDFETSPLYVFSYLKAFTRNQKVDAPSIAKIRLYTYYFYPCFDPYVEYREELIVNEKSPIHHPKKLTEMYRTFYRAKSTKGKPTKANAILKPVDEAADVILKAEFSACRGETLVDYVAARIFSLMNRVHSSTAEGRWVFKNSERDQEREAILDFARYFVIEVFEGTFKGDRARLAGRQLNLIRDTCEFLYRIEDDKARRAKKEKEGEDSEDDNLTSEEDES